MGDNTKLRRFEVDICEGCINGMGEMCDSPGCRFFLHTTAEIREFLNVLLIRPIIDGKQMPEVLCELPARKG